MKDQTKNAAKVTDDRAPARDDRAPARDDLDRKLDGYSTVARAMQARPGAKLLAGAATAGAVLAGAPALEAQCTGGTLTGIVCHQDIPDAVLSGTGPVSRDIDFDGDGDPEATLTHAGTANGLLFNFTGDQGLGGLRGFASPTRGPVAGIAAALLPGDTIAATQSFQLFSSLDNFVGKGQRFAGLKIRLSGNLYFGWVRLELSGDKTQLTVFDYAYAVIPGVTILAGQTGPLAVALDEASVE